MTPSDLLKIKVFWIKGYCAIYSVYDVNNKILSHEPNIADVVMWPEFGNSSICIREVIITLIYKDLIRKNTFLGEGGGGGSWLKFNNWGLALATNLTFYTSLSKGLKLKVRMFWGLILTFAEVTGEKLVEGAFLPPSPPPILNRVKIMLKILNLIMPCSTMSNYHKFLWSQ